MRYRLPLFAALTLAIPAYGVIPIPYVSEEKIELDGQLDDWSALLGPPLLTASDFHIWQPQKGDLFHKPLYVDFDPENLDFRIWLAWSTPGRVFAAAEFTDNIIRDEGGPLFTQADGLVIAVTPDSRERAHSYAIRPAGNLIMPFPVTGDIAARWSVWDPFAHAVRADPTPTSWGVEFFISCFDVLLPSEEGDNAGAAESVITDLAAGDEVDLVLTVTDWDADDRRSASFNLMPEYGPVRALLLSPHDTAVRQQTWGGIKALAK